METLSTIVNFIIVLGFLILIHEGGHFLAARWAGVWVHEFAVGFGPAVWKRKAKETLYALRIFPLGGYVRMAGETVTSAEGGQSNTTDEASVPANRLFMAKSAWARMFIIFAGPLTNVLGAILINVLSLASFGAPLIEVVDFSPADSPAAKALQIGDIVLSLNGTPVYSTSKILSMVSSSGERELTFEVLRNGQPVRVTVTPQWMLEQSGYRIGALFSGAQSNVIATVQADSYLYSLGVNPGDRIVAVEGVPVSSARTLNEALSRLPEDASSATLTLQRGEQALPVVLSFQDQSRTQALAGLKLQTPTRPVGEITQSVPMGIEQTWNMAVSLYQGLRAVFSGEISADRAFSGPVGIAAILTQGLEQGWGSFFFLIAFLSLNLGIINLLPFPALDGSRLLFITVELIRGKPISPEREGLVHQVGFFVLLGLLILITYNDIVKMLFK